MGFIFPSMFTMVLIKRGLAIWNVKKIVDRGYDPDIMDKLVISPGNKRVIKASKQTLNSSGLVDLELIDLI